MIPPIILIKHQNLNNIWKNLSYLEKRWFVRLLLHFEKIEWATECLKKENVLGKEEMIFWVIQTKNEKFLDFVLEKIDLSTIEKIIENEKEKKWFEEIKEKKAS